MERVLKLILRIVGLGWSGAFSVLGSGCIPASELCKPSDLQIIKNMW